MRALGLSLSILIFASSNSFGQQPTAGQSSQTPPLNVPGNDPLPGLLQQWEQRMKTIKSIQAPIMRTETDAVTGTKEEFQGTAKFLRPDRADLYMSKVNNKDMYERFLLTGNFLYEFRPREKMIRIHQLPQKAAGQPAIDDNFMGLLFGMSAQQAQLRYQLTLAGTDQYYHYISVKPKQPGDKAEFAEARLSLWKTTFLPRQIEFVQPNGNPIKWEIGTIDTNAQLGPNDFAPPKVPAGWQTKTVPPPTAPSGPGTPGAPPPTKVRPSGNS
jgi:TIGR03009 family protein